MKIKKILSLLFCTLMIVTILPIAQAASLKSAPSQEKIEITNVQSEISAPSPRDGWALQWSHDYGGLGHSQQAQPIGDIDGDGVNEVLVGGYENSGIERILHYDPVQETYVQEYSWFVPGGYYHSPSGSCIVDLNEDGNLEFCVSWGYSDADGVYAYTWDGTTLTQLDWYHGTGMNFVFDIYACDYNDDGHMEVLIANAPNMGGGGTYHVTALGWEDDHFVAQAFWACPGGSSMECPKVWSGDVDNDGKTEVIADVSNGQTATAGTWALNWDDEQGQWTGIPVNTNYPGSTVYGASVGDINGNGIPEIGIGSYGGTPGAWLFEWNGASYQQVWHQTYPTGEPVIEAVDIGDADNDGSNEFCVGAGHIHIIGWDGSAYVEEATFTDPTGMLAGMNVGDTDSDGLNEVKACEILSNTGYEFIYKYYDTTPPSTTHSFDPLTPDGENGWYVNNVNVTLYAVDEYSQVARTEYVIDEGTPIAYYGPWPFEFALTQGEHTLEYRSIDKAGNIEGWKGPFVLNIDTTVPTIALSKTVIIPGKTVKFTANVDDSLSGINKVEFYLDSDLVKTDNSAPYDYIWAGTGAHTVSAIVYDFAGNSNTASQSTPVSQHSSQQISQLPQKVGISQQVASR